MEQVEDEHEKQYLRDFVKFMDEKQSETLKKDLEDGLPIESQLPSLSEEDYNRIIEEFKEETGAHLAEIEDE